MTIRAALLAPLLLLAACHGRSSEPKVTDAWVRLPAVTGQPAAAYFTIRGGRGDAKLVRMESALAAKTEMHQSMAGMAGMTTMMPLDHVDVPANGKVEFKPGGNHAMLIGLDPVVKPGTGVPLRFGFADGTTAEAEAKTVSAGEDAPY
ncbi:copper chaperone PCu(A)C [Sphingomonas crusticola]|uniref:copper chaperone PCu(A)C n=1 Tax=Sphingomonas crusticola TaxID=1697973 RepID=UPI000E26D47C|nr:copper chaperone PCu(A)C [Sphingomonas crusticola]